MTIATNAAAGTFGGFSAHIGSNVSRIVSNDIAKATAKTATQATASAITDVGLQYVETGTVDFNRTLFNTVGHTAMAFNSEMTQNVQKRTKAYTVKINADLVKDNMKKDKHGMANAREVEVKIISGAIDLNKLRPAHVDECMKFIQKRNLERNNILKSIGSLKTHKQNLLNISNNASISNHQKMESMNQYIKDNNLPQGGVKDIKQMIAKLKPKPSKHVFMTFKENMFHYLERERMGQVALDIPVPQSKGLRGPARAIYEKVGDKFFYLDHTMVHDYKNCLKNGAVNNIRKPFDTLTPNQINQKREEEKDRKRKFSGINSSFPLFYSIY
jgi:hypothetical protein